MLRLGVHVSIAGKIHSAVDRAKKLGCSTMQIFARNPRQFRSQALEAEDVALFKAKIKKAGIKPAVIHIPYTLNLAATKRSFHKITIREFTEDYQEAGRLGAQYLVTHLGSFKGGTEQLGLGRAVTALKKILRDSPQVKTKILLENSAGSGSWLGYNFQQLRWVMEKLGWSSRLGICLDTAHAWAAGYRINESEGLKAMLVEIEKEVGLRNLKAVHLNDTQELLDSRRDRHCDIGAGLIGAKGFALILNNPVFKKLPLILETPKESDTDDKRNLAAVRALVKN